MMARAWLVVVASFLFTCGLCAEEWKFDVLHLKSRERFEGVILEETKEAVRFKEVKRQPGAPTRVVGTFSFGRDEIDRIERLGDEERKDLLERIAQLDPRGEREEVRMRALKLERTRLNDGDAWAYKGVYFSLASNAREDIVRRVIVRLEEIFDAYSKFLAKRPQVKPAKLTHVTLFKTHKEYRGALEGAGLKILNPAYYDPQKNQIVAASDLEGLADELDKLKQKHGELLSELEQQEKKMRKHFHGRPPPAMVAQLRQIRRDLAVINNENQATFDGRIQPLFATLYHEAFHAYLDNFVYPSNQATMPRWLNEGLAQIFETALVETGELRVGHVDEKRLVAVKDAVRRKQLVPLRDLLSSEWKQFVVAHASDAHSSDRYFLTSWALAYYLTFDRKLLGSERLDAYVTALHRGADRLQAFGDLVGQPLPEFEKQFLEYMRDLRPDGTLSRPK